MSSKTTAQTADNADWVHGCFMVRVGSDFKTYKEIMQYAQQDEIYGTATKPALDPGVDKIFGSNRGINSPLPIYFSKRKCRDSSLGGNDAINPLPQFNVDDDISHPHFSSEYGGDISMGQVYSENYDDTQQILYIGFGIPVFSNLNSFWSGAVDMDMANFVNKGSGITPEKIGYLIGSAPIRLIKIVTIPSKFLMMMADSLQQVPITKYYAFSSQMPMYFRFVNTILVMLATNMNLMGSSTEVNTTGSTSSPVTSVGVLSSGTKGTDDVSGMAAVFRNHGLDMAQIMTKRYLYENGNGGSITKRWTDQSLFDAAAADNGDGVATPPDPEQSTNPEPDPTEPDTSAKFWKINWLDGFKLGYANAIYDGHLFIGFRIDKGMGATESFSNQTGESQVSQTINSKFQESRDAGVTAMGNGTGQAILGGALSMAVQGAAGLLNGFTGSLSLDPLAATIAGSARIDIPEVWMNSSFNRSSSFSLTCLSPYGDMESIFQSEYVPLACLLAGALPRGTGPSSHSSPFICQAYCRGVFASPLCIIESLEVTRGADQYGFTANRLPIKLSIHVTLKDLSPVMYMNLGGDKGIAEAIFGYDDTFQEYMLTLSGMGLRDRLSPFKNIRRKTDILLSTIHKNKLSPYMLGMEGGASFKISRLISMYKSGGRGLAAN